MNYSSLNFALGETIDMLREQVQAFVAAELAPRAEAIDQDNLFPADMWKKFGEMGLLGVTGDRLAILVSCVGRKLVMGGRVDEEVEAVGEVFGQQAILTGFYSYGEISPFTPNARCELHNQTMTITTLSERAA